MSKKVIRAGCLFLVTFATVGVVAQAPGARASGYSYRVIAQAVQSTAIGTIEGLGLPSINDSGVVVYEARYICGTYPIGCDGIFNYSANGKTTVIATGRLGMDVSQYGSQYAVEFSDADVNNSGHIAFDRLDY